MKPIVTAITTDGEKVYGKFVGEYVLVIDLAPVYYPGWIPDCEEFYYDVLQLIDGTMMAVTIEDGKLIASKPDDDFIFHEGCGEIAYHTYGYNKTKRGRHSNSSNRKLNRKRIFENEPLPF